eukprot:766479-Hanusia_phi.AAC.3
MYPGRMPCSSPVREGPGTTQDCRRCRASHRSRLGSTPPRTQSSARSAGYRRRSQASSRCTPWHPRWSCRSPPDNPCRKSTPSWADKCPRCKQHIDTPEPLPLQALPPAAKRPQPYSISYSRIEAHIFLYAPSKTNVFFIQHLTLCQRAVKSLHAGQALAVHLVEAR